VIIPRDRPVFTHYGAESDVNSHVKYSGRKLSDRGSNVERIVQMQLEEKENVIRVQQATIQDLRVQITGDSRAMGARIDELGEKLRNCERERNDLRTRLAQELRMFQGSKEDLLVQISNLES